MRLQHTGRKKSKKNKKQGYTCKPDSVTHTSMCSVIYLSCLPLRTDINLKTESIFPQWGYEYTWHFNPQGLFYIHITTDIRELLPLIFTLTLHQVRRLFSVTLSVSYTIWPHPLDGVALYVVRTFLFWLSKSDRAVYPRLWNNDSFNKVANH